MAAPRGKARANREKARFLREIILDRVEDSAATQAQNWTATDWVALFDFAREHSVAATIWPMVREEVRSRIPEPARSRLRQAHLDSTAANAILIASAARAQALLESRGVCSIVLKGTALVAVHTEDVGCRQVGDVDLLVQGRDRPLAEQVLREDGFTTLNPVVRYDGSPRTALHSVAREEVSLLSPEGVPFDLLDRLPGGSTRGDDVAVAIASATTATWQGWKLQVPSGPDLAFGICLHVFAHHADASRLLLRHLVDLSILFGQGKVDWSDVEARASTRRARSAVRASRELLEQGAPGIVAAQARSLVIRFNSRATVIRAVGNSPSAMWRMAFPAREYMVHRYRVPESSVLFPLLYLWRPLRGAWKLFTGR